MVQPGGNYFISPEHVVCRLSMQRLKLYNQLDIQQLEGTNMNSCAQDLESNDEDMELVESSFIDSIHLNEEERSTLYYISGCVAF